MYAHRSSNIRRHPPPPPVFTQEYEYVAINHRRRTRGEVKVEVKMNSFKAGSPCAAGLSVLF